MEVDDGMCEGEERRPEVSEAAAVSAYCASEEVEKSAACVGAQRPIMASRESRGSIDVAARLEQLSHRANG